MVLPGQYVISDNLCKGMAGGTIFELNNRVKDMSEDFGVSRD